VATQLAGVKYIMPKKKGKNLELGYGERAKSRK